MPRSGGSATRRRAEGWVRRALARRGYALRRADPMLVPGGQFGQLYPVDFDQRWIATIERVRDYTQTTVERMASLCAATEHIARKGVPGSFVECGVWRGGSMMAVALTLLEAGVRDRELFLFDTFAGMTAPSAHDSDYLGRPIAPGWDERVRDQGAQHAVGLDEVREALLSTGYPGDRLHFVEGPVEETLPATETGEIALLRLDTDWYESTRHELEHLYPRLVRGGVLVVDDYGVFHGARRATDEYFDADPVLLHRVDVAGRLVVKQ